MVCFFRNAAITRVEECGPALSEVVGEGFGKNAAGKKSHNEARDFFFPFGGQDLLFFLLLSYIDISSM